MELNALWVTSNALWVAFSVPVVFRKDSHLPAGAVPLAPGVLPPPGTRLIDLGLDKRRRAAHVSLCRKGVVVASKDVRLVHKVTVRVADPALRLSHRYVCVRDVWSAVP